MGERDGVSSQGRKSTKRKRRWQQGMDQETAMTLDFVIHSSGCQCTGVPAKATPHAQHLANCAVLHVGKKKLLPDPCRQSVYALKHEI